MISSVITMSLSTWSGEWRYLQLKMGIAVRANRADHNRLLANRLQSAMPHLSDPQRQAIVLFHQQDLNLQEVAAVMGVPVSTVKSHLHRGRLAMRKILAPDPEVNPQ